MNKQRREELIDAALMLEDVACSLSNIRDEEEDAWSSLPEGLAYSSRGVEMQDAIDTIDKFVDDLSAIQSDIEAFASNKKANAPINKIVL